MSAPTAAARAREDIAALREQSLKTALAAIEKQFGRGAVMRLGAVPQRAVPAVATGSLAVDQAIGVGGVPRGRVTEVFGPESSGKTTLCLSVVAQAQQTSGGTAAYIDAEHALDPTYAKTVGVRLDDLLISQPDTGEQALEIAESLVRSNALDVLVVDSVAALVPRAELEGEMGDSHVGLQARLMSHALRKLTSAIAKSQTAVLFVNQLREKIGVMFGNPEVTPGGRALKFYASVRLDLRKIESLKVQDRVVGNRVRCKVVKNKLAPPFRQAEFEIHYDEGISRTSEVLDLGEPAGLISRQGTWLSYQTTKLGQGREAARAFLKEHPEILKDLENKLRAAAPSATAAAEAVEVT